MWSSQRYKSDGKALGIDKATLDEAVQRVERTLLVNPKLPALLTLKHLAIRAGVNYSSLYEVVHRVSRPYKHFRIRKRSGGYRWISIPTPELAQAQKWINAYILSQLTPHPCSSAFSPKSSIVKCAQKHCAAKWLVKMDIQNFFGSISEIQVYRIFRKAGYGKLISFELARLTTFAAVHEAVRYRFKQWNNNLINKDRRYVYRDSRVGFLPQGAPTSPMLSNLVMVSVDDEIQKLASAANLTYTRYSDDLTFSTRKKNFSRAKAVKLISDVTKILIKKGLYPQTKKTAIIPPGARKIVLGLIVNEAQPHLPKEFKSNLRQHLYYLKKYGPQEHIKKRGFDSVLGLYHHLRGLIDFAKMVERSYAEEMLKELHAISWPL